ITVTIGSRRRLTAFWDLALVSNQTSPSSTAYHMATRCGRPLGDTVASVAVRLCAMKVSISLAVMTIFERSFCPKGQHTFHATLRLRTRPSAYRGRHADAEAPKS